MKLYELMRRPPWFLSVASWITKDDRPVQAGPNARPAVLIPLLLMQYGSLTAKLRTFKDLRHYLATSFVNMRESAKGIGKNPRTGKKHIDEETLRELERYAREQGVSGVGYTRVNPNFIFRQFEILYDNAIVLTMEMNKEVIDTNPSFEAGQEIHRTYAALGVAVNRIADFLRERGFNCHPSPAIGGDICTVPTAQDANLGAVGKNGILVTPEFGPCVRLAAVFVDIENLPVAQHHDHRWISDFCESCNRCVRACPGGAIFTEPRFLPDGTRVFIEREKCAPAFSESCSKCISECVFTGGHYDKIKAGYFKALEARANGD